MGTAPKLHEKIIKLVSAELKGKILDVPCGKGELTSSLRDEGFEITAADISGSFFNYPDIKFEKVDLNRMLPFKDEEFDLITCIEGAEHLENIYHLFRELARVLKRGGKLIVSTPNILSVFSRLRFFMTGQFDFFGGYYADETNFYTYHINPVYYPLLKLALQRAGFEVEKITTNRDIVGEKKFLLRSFLRLICFVARKITVLKVSDKKLAGELNSKELLRGEILILKCIRR